MKWPLTLRQRAVAMRNRGMRYGKIAKRLGVSENQVYAAVRRHMRQRGGDFNGLSFGESLKRMRLAAEAKRAKMSNAY